MVNQRSHAERWVETSSPENLKKSLYENQYWMFVIFRLIFRITSQLSSSAHRHFAAGPVFGNMNQFTGLGVFLDTYPNADKSYDVSDACFSSCFSSFLRPSGMSEDTTWNSGSIRTCWELFISARSLSPRHLMSFTCLYPSPAAVCYSVACGSAEEGALCLTSSSSSQRVFPYVSVMLGNGTLLYDHDRDGRTTELGGCTAMVRNSLYDTFLLIRYSGNRLTVRYTA